MKKKHKAGPTEGRRRPERKAHSAAESGSPPPIADQSSNVEEISPESLRRLSRRLLAPQEGRQPYAHEFVQRFEHGCQSFHAELAMRVGSATFQNLLWRSLQISKDEFPYLQRVTLEAASRCSFDALREPLKKNETRSVEEALTVVLANLIRLLVKIIGYRYVLHLLHEVWPHVSIEEARTFLTV